MPARPEAGDEEMEGILYLLQEFKGKVVLFGISDVVDIAIMAFLIYKVIMLMRRTNSGAVAKGVLLLLFALGVSTFFHLNTVIRKKRWKLLSVCRNPKQGHPLAMMRFILKNILRIRIISKFRSWEISMEMSFICMNVNVPFSVVTKR